MYVYQHFLIYNLGLGCTALCISPELYLQDPGNADFQLRLQTQDGQLDIYVRKRPFLDEFLEIMAERFEVGIFTASVREYASKVIEKIDPKGYIQWALYRDSCSLHGGCAVKDLETLPRSLGRAILVDDRATSFMLQRRNGIECTAFEGDPEDTELKSLQAFLSDLSQEKGDLRHWTSQWFDFLKSKIH